jgi:hypothetical protein
MVQGGQGWSTVGEAGYQQWWWWMLAMVDTSNAMVEVSAMLDTTIDWQSVQVYGWESLYISRPSKSTILNMLRVFFLTKRE